MSTGCQEKKNFKLLALKVVAVAYLGGRLKEVPNLVIGLGNWSPRAGEVVASGGSTVIKISWKDDIHLINAINLNSNFFIPQKLKIFCRG